MIFSPLCYHTRRGTWKGTSYATVMPYFTCLDNMWKSSLRDVLIAAIMQVHENREIGIIFRRHRTFEPFPHTMLGGEWEQLCLHAGVIIVLLTVKSFVLTSITNSVEAIGATDTCMLLVRKCEVVNSCGALIDPSTTRDIRRNRQSWTMTRYWVILWVLVGEFIEENEPNNLAKRRKIVATSECGASQEKKKTLFSQTRVEKLKISSC